MKRRRLSLLVATATALAAGFALVAVALAGGFGGGSSHALYGSANGLSGPVGARRVWATGGTALCTTGHSPVVLTSVTPLEVTGQIRLNRVVMRHVGSADAITLQPGVPAGSHPVAGYVIQSPSPCAWPFGALMNEVVVLATRTGPYGGSIDGLRIDYTSGGSSGSYLIPNYFARLCGPYGCAGP